MSCDGFSNVLLAQTVEVLVPAQKHFIVDQRRRCIKPIVERVFGQYFISRPGTNHDGGSLTAGEVHAPARRDGRRKYIGDAVEPLILKVRAAGFRVEGRKNA